MISIRSHIPFPQMQSRPAIPLPRPPHAKPDRFGPVQTIAWQEAARVGITYAQITGDCRQRVFTAARHMAMWRASRETMASLKTIGRVFGHRDHTTVLYAIRKVDGLIAAAANDNQK